MKLREVCLVFYSGLGKKGDVGFEEAAVEIGRVRVAGVVGDG